MSDARSLISSDHIDVFYIYYSFCCNSFYLWLVTRSCCSFILVFFFKNRNCSTINLLNLHVKRKIVFYFCFTFICIFKIAFASSNCDDRSTAILIHSIKEMKYKSQNHKFYRNDFYFFHYVNDNYILQFVAPCERQRTLLYKAVHSTDINVYAYKIYWVLR